uniref:Eukaryotic translation initiation factor 3 subunit L (inferred by orthology to a zebrafish protein) n=1 Tax=Strongyloides venezuelensis TaxID=75913 RepID=A0A0K0FF35_STRVS
MDTKNSANPPSNFDKNSDIPTEVIKFIVYMKKLYDNRSVNELKQVYDQGFIDISEKYYLERPWPNPSVIEKVITNPKQYFMIIYKEIYYKSIKKPLPLYIQCDSFTNLSSFFSLLLNSGKETEHPVTFLLPANWIWDIIESFINQYVSFCHYKANHSLRTIEENRQLEEI